MYIVQLLQQHLPILNSHERVEDALRLMEDHDLQQIPLVEEEKYKCLLQEEALLSLDMEVPLQAFLQTDFKPKIKPDAHPYDALRLMYDKKLQVLPVADEEDKYFGAVTLSALAHFMATNGSLHDQGGIVVIEVPQQHYSLWELARISESEGIKILTAQVQKQGAAPNYQITLKVDTNDLNGLLQALDRHSITVLQVFGDTALNEDMAQRYDELMHYINM